jgi:hypothetical protein
MSSFDVLPLQAAIHAALIEDAQLMEKVHGVYDYVPQNVSFPYVVWEDSQARRWGNAQQEGIEQLLTLHVYSRGAGRKEAGDILHRLNELLHHATFTVEGYALISLTLRSVRIELGKDGLTYQGTAQMQALLRLEAE